MISKEHGSEICVLIMKHLSNIIIENPTVWSPTMILINSSKNIFKNTEKTYREDFCSCNTLSILHVFSKTTGKRWKKCPNIYLEHSSHKIDWPDEKQNINNGWIFLSDSSLQNLNTSTGGNCYKEYISATFWGPFLYRKINPFLFRFWILGILFNFNEKYLKMGNFWLFRLFPEAPTGKIEKNFSTLKKENYITFDFNLSTEIEDSFHRNISFYGGFQSSFHTHSSHCTDRGRSFHHDTDCGTSRCVYATHFHCSDTSCYCQVCFHL